MIRKLKSLGSYSLITVLFSCCSAPPEDSVSLYDPSIIQGIASPMQLQPDSTRINIQDYVLDIGSIDSVTTTDATLEVKPVGKFVDLIGNSQSHLTNLSFWVSGKYCDVLVRKSSKKTMELIYDQPAGEVKAKGEFNAWNAENTILSKQQNGTFSSSMELSPGKYQYLLVVDGVEMLDPSNPDYISNGIGGWNSLINIPRPKKELLPILETTSKDEYSLRLTSDNDVLGVFAYWQNELLPDSNVKWKNNTVEVIIPPYAQDYKRSFIRIWAFNESGVSNDILIPLQDGKIVNTTKELTRADKAASIFYFLMVDRFNNGNLENDEPINDPDVHPKANYYGGDIEGVINQLQSGYFDSLGINTIWLSPIAQNPTEAYGKYPEPKTTFSGYHGYWPISSSKIDYRFGTGSDLKKLVDLAHEKNMNVILDYVANHVHEKHPVYQQHKDWATDLYLPDGSLNTERWDDHRLTTWFDTFLPTLDFSKPEVVNTMTDSALYWLEKYRIDGFRHDATKHIPLEFWRTLTKKIKKKVVLPENKAVFQIGETYGSRELINSYINSGMLDAQFDFNVYDDAVQTFARDEVTFERLVTSISESIAYYGDHNLMGNITGNQDRARFISYADGSIQFEEDAKLAGWTRQIEVRDSSAYQKLNILTAFMMSIPGIPVIYYGDEIGMPGGNDPDNRRMMRFNNLRPKERVSREVTSKLIQFRKNNMAMIYGDFKILSFDHSTLVLKRKYFDNEVIVVFNKSSEQKSVAVSAFTGRYSALFNSTIEGATLKLPAYSFEILKRTD